MTSFLGLANLSNQPAVPALQPAVHLPQEFSLQVLEREYLTVQGTVRHLAGRRLIARFSSALPAGTCVRINCEDSFLLGEVLECWREDGETVAALDIVQALTRLSEWAAWQNDSTDRRDSRRTNAVRRLA